jgi:acetyl-CoA carboxylase biotin carboxyl carrier protein
MTGVKADMAATVWKVKAAVGDEVSVGDELVVLESMKMEIPVESPVAGVVSWIADEGSLVSPGDLLAEIAKG